MLREIGVGCHAGWRNVDWMHAPESAYGASETVTQCACQLHSNQLHLSNQLQCAIDWQCIKSMQDCVCVLEDMICISNQKMCYKKMCWEECFLLPHVLLYVLYTCMCAHAEMANITLEHMYLYTHTCVYNDLHETSTTPMPFRNACHSFYTHSWIQNTSHIYMK